MPKEILIYGDLYGYIAESVINQLNEARNSDITVRFNSNGGELKYGWGILTKIKELKGRKVFKNDGEANSMSGFAFCYNNDNEATDVSTFGFHRASYGEYYEKSDQFTDQDRQELIDKNKNLRAALEAKVDVPIFERVANCTLDTLFDLSSRREVCLTAAQALECKLIERVVQLTPKVSEDIEAKSNQIIALYGNHFLPKRLAAKTETQPITKSMESIEEILAKRPDLYNAIFAKGKATGIELEKDRVGSILAYIDADKKGVIEAIKGDKPLTETQRSEFAIKAGSLVAAAKIEGENAPAVTVSAEESIPAPVTPAATAKTEADKKTTAELEKSLSAEFKKLFPNSKKAA